MSRPASLDKFQTLVATAVDHFIAHGYQRTQVADIAARMGVANGTVYTYVESKEALFDLAVRHADDGSLAALPAVLPVPTPPAGATLSYVRTALSERAVFPLLQAALKRPESPVLDPETVTQEIMRVAGEIYDVLAKNRRALRLGDRCAADYPELAALWFSGGRVGLVTLLEAYLNQRARQLRPIPHPAITARLTLEVLVLWAVHRHFDPHPQPMDEAAARAEALSFVTHALVEVP